MSYMKCVSVISNINRDNNLIHTSRLVDTLTKAGVTVKMEKEYCVKGAASVSREELFTDSEMVIAMGGDGTILSLASECAENDIPIFGINLGHMGFLSVLEMDDFSQILSSDYHTEERFMLKAAVNGKTICGLNDICISRGCSARIINIKVYADDKLVGSYDADGFIVSTPTGSTAYSLSAGGPVVYPGMALMILTPVCSHSLNNARSVIIPAASVVKIFVESEHDNDAMVSADGQNSMPIADGVAVEIKKSDKKLKLMRKNDSDFFDTMRLKLER